MSSKHITRKDALAQWNRQYTYPEEDENRYDWPNYFEAIVYDFIVIIQKLKFYRKMVKDKGLSGCFICELEGYYKEIEKILKGEAKKDGSEFLFEETQN